MVTNNFIEQELELLQNGGWIDDIEKTKENFNKARIINRKTNTQLSITRCIDMPNIRPNKEDIFNAFKLFPMQDTRVLIIGQDPYPDKDKKREKYGNRAHGLAFSFANKNELNEPADASLLNIFKAIKVYQYKEENNIIKNFGDIKLDEVNWNTNLETWAKNNKVLLLNIALTYNNNISLTNRKNMWKPFIKEVMTKLIYRNTNSRLAMFLWGVTAQQLFYECIKTDEHYTKDFPQELYEGKLVKTYSTTINNNKIFMTSHPSNTGGAVNQGFSHDAPIHFGACDEFLKENKDGKYTWKDFAKVDNT